MPGVVRAGLRLIVNSGVLDSALQKGAIAAAEAQSKIVEFTRCLGVIHRHRLATVPGTSPVFREFVTGYLNEMLSTVIAENPIDAPEVINRLVTLLGVVANERPSTWTAALLGKIDVVGSPLAARFGPLGEMMSESATLWMDMTVEAVRRDYLAAVEWADVSSKTV